MGSFYINGFQTQLPISCGDEVVIFLGVKKKGINPRNEFSPGKIFTPVMLPMFGVYGDCGIPIMIKKDKNTWWLEEIIGFPLEIILSVLDDHEVGRWTKDEDAYEKLIDPLLKYFYFGNNFNPAEDIVTFILDHKFLYTSGRKISDEEWEYLKTRTDQVRKMDPIDRLSVYDRQLDPSLSIGSYYGSPEYHRSSLLMSLFHGKYDYLIENLEDDYRNFIGFFDWYRGNNWIMNSHSYGGQNVFKEDLLPFYEKMVKYLKDHD